MKCDPSRFDRINQYALVSYVPGELGLFLDELRRELVHGCTAQSHVTILPPRPLEIPAPEAETRLRESLGSFRSFHLELTGIRVFPKTSVIFADLGQGRDNLLEMHERMNTDGFAFDEPYMYHPHITLAQGLVPEQVPSLFDLAQKRWQERLPAESFQVDTLTFVQNTALNLWVDLADYDLDNPAIPVGQGKSGSNHNHV